MNEDKESALSVAEAVWLPALAAEATEIPAREVPWLTLAEGWMLERRRQSRGQDGAIRQDYELIRIEATAEEMIKLTRGLYRTQPLDWSAGDWMAVHTPLLAESHPDEEAQLREFVASARQILDRIEEVLNGLSGLRS